MKSSKKIAKEITKALELRLIKDRVIFLIKKGYKVEELPMGSGGVGQIKCVKNENRIQIGYGHGRHNYAYSVILPIGRLKLAGLINPRIQKLFGGKN